MVKTNKTLACPTCKTEGIKMIAIDSIKEENNENVSILMTNRMNGCYCEKCHNWYLVDCGKSILKRYHYPVSETLSEDVTLHAVYGSEYDKSYKIITIDGVTMIMMEDEEYPIILDDNNKEEMINMRSSAKKLVKKTLISRHG